MLLTISTTHHPATDLGYLLHKNPSRLQSEEISFGTAYVFYPEATAELCTVALLVEIDPTGLVRGVADRQGNSGSECLRAPNPGAISATAAIDCGPHAVQTGDLPEMRSDPGKASPADRRQWRPRRRGIHVPVRSAFCAPPAAHWWHRSQ